MAQLSQGASKRPLADLKHCLFSGAKGKENPSLVVQAGSIQMAGLAAQPTREKR
jgi:hypothetical protein